MSETLTRDNCLLETIMVSNSNRDGLELQASAILGEALGDAATSGEVVTVNCEKCGTEFAVRHAATERAPAFFRSDNQCDGPAGRGLSTKAGEWALNINMRNLRERGALSS